MKNTILKVKHVHNNFYYTAGLILLFLNKIKHLIEGYTNPRTFNINKSEEAIKYDFEVVDNWMYHLRKYTDEDFSLKNKTILELGPGADLGVGIIILMLGAKKYNSIDVNNLVKSVPDIFYKKLFHHIKKIPVREKGVSYLKHQLELTAQSKNNKLNYVYNKNFDLSKFKTEDIDLIFSQAAFEHFDDVNKTINSLGKIVKSGGILIAEIDLKTHTRWIRDEDPLNIYRYNNFIYNLFKFKGSPNRLRPYEYKNILEQNGWKNIKIEPRYSIEREYLSKIELSLNDKFKNKVNQMDYLSIIISATKI